MERNHIVSNLEIELNTNTASEQDPKSDIYEVMHMDRNLIYTKLCIWTDL